jgi:uncharacterized membrane protein
MTREAVNGTERKVRVAILLAALAALVFLAGTFVAPYAESAGRGWGRPLRLVYFPACHQIPERSLAVARSTQAVCARCSGLYIGGVVGLLAGAWLVSGTRLRPRPIWLVWTVAPIVIDLLLPRIGLQGLSNIPRLILALPAGFVAALFLAVGIGDLVGKAENRPRNTLVPDGSRALEEIDG